MEEVTGNADKGSEARSGTTCRVEGRSAAIAMAEALLSPWVTRRVIQELALQQRYVPRRT